MPPPRTIPLDASTYFALEGPPRRLRERLNITVTGQAFPPYVEDLAADWVASVATPAFKALAARRGPGRSGAFCSIGTGTGLDALGAAEIFEATRIGITDLHDEVVAAAARNIRDNLRDASGLSLLAGTGDLLAPLAAEAPRFDVIYENLPNVPIGDPAQLEEGRTSSSFVPPRTEPVPPGLGAALLTLHYLALVQARPLLAPGGAVLSMLGARVPLQVFLAMSREAGFRPSFLTYGWKVQAEADEVLSGHAGLQRQGLGPFHFHRVEDLERVFAGLSPEAAALRAEELEAALAPHRLDAEAALAAWRRGARVGHTYAVLLSELAP